MAHDTDGATAGRLPVDARIAALRTLVSAMIPDGFQADKLTPKARAEVRAGIDAALVLYDHLSHAYPV